MSFSTGMGNGSMLEFEAIVNSDDFVEWDELIVISLVDPQKSNVLLLTNQVMITIVDIDSKLLVNCFGCKIIIMLDKKTDVATV